MPYDVFISHSAKDKITADAICARLESAGIRCWIAPRDIMPGLDWSEAIVRAIENCSIMVLVFSVNANSSPQIKREVERATNKEKIIVPFRIDDVTPTKSLEYFISTSHWLDAFTPPLKIHIDRLTKIIKTLLNSPEENDPNLSSAQRALPLTQAHKGFFPVLLRWAVIPLVAGGAFLLSLWFFAYRNSPTPARPTHENTLTQLETPSLSPSNERGPSWSELIDRARAFRQSGKISDAIATFAKYGEMFGEKYPSAKQYVKVAQSFTLQYKTLEVTGGTYIYEVIPGGLASEAGLAVGDIIIGYGRYPVYSTKSFIDSRTKLEAGKTTTLEFLRMNEAGHFQKKVITISYGPLGVYVMDI